MHSDQMGKDGISESIIQALITTLLPNMLYDRACIMDSEIPYFLVWSLCIMRYTVYIWSYLLSFLCNPYMPFLIYEIFNLLVIIRILLIAS